VCTPGAHGASICTQMQLGAAAIGRGSSAPPPRPRHGMTEFLYGHAQTFYDGASILEAR